MDCGKLRLAASQELNPLEEVRCARLSSLYRCAPPSSIDDPAQVEPGANDAIEPQAQLRQQPAHPRQRADGLVVDAGHPVAGSHVGAVDPGKCAVGDPDDLITEPLDLDLALALADAQGLDRQQFPLARGLENVRGRGELVPVEFLDDLLASRNQVRPGHEDSLMDDRALGTLLVVNRLDGPERIVSLLLEIAAALGNRHRQHVPDVMEFDDRVSVSVSGHFA